MVAMALSEGPGVQSGLADYRFLRSQCSSRGTAFLSYGAADPGLHDSVSLWDHVLEK